MSGTAPYDRQAFSPLPGRCFRLIGRGGQGPAPLPGAARLAWVLAGAEWPPLPGRGVPGPPTINTSSPPGMIPPRGGWLPGPTCVAGVQPTRSAPDRGRVVPPPLVLDLSVGGCPTHPVYLLLAVNRHRTGPREMPGRVQVCQTLPAALCGRRSPLRASVQRGPLIDLAQPTDTWLTAGVPALGGPVRDLDVEEHGRGPAAVGVEQGTAAAASFAEVAGGAEQATEPPPSPVPSPSVFMVVLQPPRRPALTTADRAPAFVPFHQRGQVVPHGDRPGRGPHPHPRQQLHRRHGGPGPAGRLSREQGRPRSAAAPTADALGVAGVRLGTRGGQRGTSGPSRSRPLPNGPQRPTAQRSPCARCRLPATSCC